MWVMTTAGFFSVVEVEGQPDQVQIRARRKKDLTTLQQTYIPHAVIVHSPDADYAYRIITRKAVWVAMISELAENINYSNFKNEIAKKDKPRAALYSRVWALLGTLQR